MANYADISQSLIESYNRKKAADIAALMANKQNDIAAVDRSISALPTQYQGIKNNAASQRALGGQAFNEMAAGTGLNSGASGQGALALNNVLQNALGAADREQASKTADLNLQRNQIQNKYNAQESQIGADYDSQMLQSLASQLNADRSFGAQQNAYQNQLAQQERSNFLQGIGAYANDFTGQVNNIRNDGDPSNDWQIALLQSANNERQIALAESEAKANQQGIENQQAWARINASNKPSTGNSNGGMTVSDITKLVDAGIISEEQAQLMLGMTPTTMPQNLLTEQPTPLNNTNDSTLANKVTNSVDSERGGTDWVRVAGYGRLGWNELLNLVNSGTVEEIYNPQTGQYTYKKKSGANAGSAEAETLLNR